MPPFNVLDDINKLKTASPMAALKPMTASLDIDPSLSFEGNSNNFGEAKEAFQNQYQEAKSAYNKFDPNAMSMEQLGSQAILAFLPLVAGRLLGGNRGGVAGAEAGGVASQVYGQQVKAGAARKQQELLDAAQTAGLEYKQAGDLEKQFAIKGMDFNDKVALKGMGGGSDEKPVPQLAKDILAKTLETSPDQAGELIDYFGRGTANFLYPTGQNVRAPSEKLQDKVSTSKTLVDKIGRIQNDLAQIDSQGLFENLVRDYSAISADTLEGQVARQLKELAFDIAKDKQAANSISNADLRIVNDMIRGGVFTSTEGISQLLETLKNNSKQSLDNRLDAAKASRVNVDKLSEVANSGSGVMVAKPRLADFNGNVNDFKEALTQFLYKEKGLK